MADYAVTDWSSNVGSPAEVLAEMETQIETIDDGKTLRYIDILKVGENQFIGVLIYDA